MYNVIGHYCANVCYTNPLLVPDYFYAGHFGLRFDISIPNHGWQKGHTLQKIKILVDFRISSVMLGDQTLLVTLCDFSYAQS